MKLLIVESPAKAKTISKYLGDEYDVKASVGHVRDLPKSNKKAIDIEGGFIPHYEISKGKEKVVAELKHLAKKAEKIILATDEDREGEAIAWHIGELLDLGLDKTKIQRVTYNEITKEAILEALENPREIDQNLRRAQEARRVLDRLVGYDLSGLIWKKVRYGLSAGRVQSPALRIIMEREREIRAFKPEKFWVINADVESSPSNTSGLRAQRFSLVCSEEPRDEKEVKRILKIGGEIHKDDWKIVDLSETEVKRAPRAPFITSTLQQTASSRLGFAPSRTMGIAQKLYESGHITYMRTDSTNLSKLALGQIFEIIEKKYGKEYLSPRTYAVKSKNAQEAHEAIRPSHMSVETAGLNDEQHKLYRLIWQRTAASQMAEAKMLRSKITANVNNKECRGQTSAKQPMQRSDLCIPDFAITGQRVLFPGWLSADPEASGEDVVLPKVKLGEKLNLLKIDSEGKETQPPPRYSEAGLVKELEKRGIGRPSTYASIIKTLDDRGYVEKINKALVPTDTGDVVSTFLENHFTNYISDSFTAEMEDELDDIASGKREYAKTLKDFYTPFTKEVKSKDKTMEKITNLGAAPDEFKCPVCGAAMIIKLGKNGKFMSCGTFPKCAGARTIEGKEIEGPKLTGEKCPLDDGDLVLRQGKFGAFISCANYPKCKYIKKDKELEKQNSTGVECPVCKKGFMVERKGKFGLFFSCSNYPQCKTAIKAKPTGNLCPMCGSLMMEGTKTIPERCSSKVCPNHNPHKLAGVK